VASVHRLNCRRRKPFRLHRQVSAEGPNTWRNRGGLGALASVERATSSVYCTRRRSAAAYPRTDRYLFDEIDGERRRVWVQAWATHVFLPLAHGSFARVGYACVAISNRQRISHAPPVGQQPTHALVPKATTKLRLKCCPAYLDTFAGPECQRRRVIVDWRYPHGRKVAASNQIKVWVSHVRSSGTNRRPMSSDRCPSDRCPAVFRLRRIRRTFRPRSPWLRRRIAVKQSGLNPHSPASRRSVFFKANAAAIPCFVVVRRCRWSFRTRQTQSVVSDDNVTLFRRDQDFARP